MSVSENVDDHYYYCCDVDQKIVSEVILNYIFVGAQATASDLHADPDPNKHDIDQEAYENYCFLPVCKNWVDLLLIRPGQDNNSEHVFDEDDHYSEINEEIPKKKK